MGKVKSAQKSKVKGHITQMKKTSKVTHLRNVQLHFQDDSSSRLDLCPVNAQTDERTDGRTDAGHWTTIAQLSQRLKAELKMEAGHTFYLNLI